MRKTLFIVFISLCCSAPAFAQVSVEVSAPPPPRIEVGLPTVQFAAPPPLVEVSPGVSVVRDCDEEVFFHDGFYWHAGAGGVWYRTRDWHGGWVAAPRHGVPVAIMRLPRGRYRHWHGGPGVRAERHELRAEHREIRAQRHELHAERRAERHELRAERHEAHGGGRFAHR